MAWKNLFSIGKMHSSLFVGSKQIDLRNTTNGATWTNPSVSSFASSLSTKNNAFVFETSSSISGQIANWWSSSTLCKEINVGEYKIRDNEGGYTYSYNARVKEVLGTINFKLSISKYGDSSKNHSLYMDFMMNGSLIARIHTIHDGYTLDSSRCMNLKDFTYYTYSRLAGDEVNDYIQVYNVFVEILRIEEAGSLNIDTSGFNISVGGQASPKIILSSEIRNLSFYDIQNTTNQQAQCLAVAIENFN
ncbi:MAG: hypothetical protein ACRDDY_03870 [Clostridium sp.]|uniref:hypothetical protein n=1 Tax=Clostridium sp. TaxID=1506 RepID=UPI003EE5BF56